MITVRPQMNGGLSLDKLGIDSQPLAGLAYATCEHVPHAQLAADPLHVHCLSLVSEAGIAGDNEQPFDAREACDDVLYNPVGKVLLLRIAAQVLEWQHSDRGFIRQSEVERGDLRCDTREGSRLM